VTDDAIDPRDAVLELLLDAGHEPHRRDELRAIVDRDPAALAELQELERIDDLLRTAGPMLEPSEDLMARVLAIPDEAQPGADVAWDVEGLGHVPASGFDDALDGAIAPPEPGPDGPTLLADIMPPSRRPRRPDRDRRRETGGFWRNIVVWRAATVGFAALALACGVWALSGDDDGGSEQQAEAPATVTVPANTDVSGPNVQVRMGQGERAEASVIAEAAGEEGRRVRIRIDGLAATPNRVYTVWIARSPQRRIPLATVRPDAQGNIDVTVTVPKLPPAYKGIWVTREPQSGRKGWSNDWVLRGALS
jgi:Anti-sigma-K factor rskA